MMIVQLLPFMHPRSLQVCSEIDYSSRTDCELGLHLDVADDQFLQKEHNEHQASSNIKQQ